ncbi:MAG: hypothetical protein NVSMB62_03250 [Acidobacteriaceae bacterium]
MTQMRFLVFAVLVAGLTLTGCHSAYIQVTISNRTQESLPLIEVDYPSASFGTQNLAPGGDFHYRFKVLGAGATAVLWTDPVHHEHKTGGPSLREGDEGRLSLTFTAAGPQWTEALSKR